jgi:D-alanyl-lipoteichoic acid acyltransferase DltB (MBOAT superfamily)
MVFPSIEFAIFFPIVLVLSWALMPRHAQWKAFAIVASYAFYAAANWKFCFLLGAVTLLNHGGAVLVHRSDDDRRRKHIVAATVTLDLLLLGVFKYYGFFVEDVNGLLDHVGLSLPLPVAQIALPVGISFFTFQAITYIVDVYRRLVEPASLVDAAVYLSFFPHLVAGPIVRASEFIPQLAKPRNPSRVALGAAMTLIVAGLVKKVGIADTLAREIVDPVFAVPEQYGTWDVLLAGYAYAAQIYCDFSGYTDMAIGLALLMGFRFPQNFDRPYRAASFREFWRRWHMTLSRFLRDYLYIPLGGNRGSRWFMVRNLMLTMLLGGLWHGAAITFVIWGGLHGLYLVAERALEWLGTRRPNVWVRRLIVFHGVVLAWVLFRSSSLDVAGTFIGRLAHPAAAQLWSPLVLALVIGVLAVQLAPERPLARLRIRFESLQPAMLGAALAVTVLVVAATVSSQGVPPFIYFRF